MFFGCLTIPINGLSMGFNFLTIAVNGFWWYRTIGQTMRWFQWIVVVYFWCITSFLYYLIVQNYALFVMLRTSMLKLDLSKLCKFCILIWIMHISQRFPKVFHKISPRFPQDFPQDSTRFLQDSLNHPHSSYLTTMSPIILKNIARVGSFRHIVFVYFFVLVFVKCNAVTLFVYIFIAWQSIRTYKFGPNTIRAK